jgi:dTDP-4-dehydrorhamnose 3,5-epimerase
MKIYKTKIKDLLIIKQKINLDKRGNLRETFNDKLLNKKFIFEYCTTSKINVLRGFHFQTKFKQAKYVNVVKGKILDVVIDLRKKSKTFGKIFKIILSKKNAIGLFIPAGFGHAYYSFEKENIIYYKLDNYYMPKYENGIIYNDKHLKIKWPRKKMIVSKKDNNLLSFDTFCNTFNGL